jgi:hypothetical protein
MSFEAKYGGWCADCDDRIQPGDTVTYNEDDALIHMHCEGLAPARIAEVCGKCWLTKPCECEEEG